MSASTILHTLWSATDAKNLSDEQLATLSCNECLTSQLSDVAEIMMGIGCLIAEEGRTESKTGNFKEPDSIAQLLWALSDVIDTAAAASFVANDAKTLILHRAQGRAGKQKGRVTA